MITIYGLKALTPVVKGVVRDIRAVWAIEELGLPYEHKILDSASKEHKQPSFLALNPFGKVPTMTDGGFVLFESAAICTYLADKAGKMIPKAGTNERAIHDQWVCFSIATLEPNAFRLFGFDHFGEMDATKRIMREDVFRLVTGFLKVVDGELSKRPYLASSEFSIADVMFGSVCRIVTHTEIANALPHLDAYLNKVYARPAFKKALETNGGIPGE